jgi:hypothetical protein
MTKEEAIAAMKSGKKVTHKYFDEKEWATMVGGMIFLDDGVKCTPADFWQIRWEHFETGWSLFKEPFGPEYIEGMKKAEEQTIFDLNDFEDDEDEQTEPDYWECLCCFKS